MFLFIFESFGTSELLLIGIAALVLLGPRRMPEMAKKAAKLMAEFRGTANEFKQTWQNEVNFEEEAKMLDISAIETEPVPREAKPVEAGEASAGPEVPTIKELDPAQFAELEKAARSAEAKMPPPAADDPNDKQNWL